METNQDVNFPDNRATDFEFDNNGNIYGIEIGDDVDDEAMYGRHRHGRQSDKHLINFINKFIDYEDYRTKLTNITGSL